MLDLQFDLLAKLYISYLEKDFSFIEKFVKNYNKDNVSGVIANLCFMSKDKTKSEYHKKYYRYNIMVIEMFIILKQLLDKLYTLNLRSILPVWNEENKYGLENCLIKG